MNKQLLLFTLCATSMIMLSNPTRTALNWIKQNKGKTAAIYVASSTAFIFNNVANLAMTYRPDEFPNKIAAYKGNIRELKRGFDYLQTVDTETKLLMTAGAALQIIFCPLLYAFVKIQRQNTASNNR